MTTFNTAAAPQAPAYLVSVTGIKAGKGDKDFTVAFNNREHYNAACEEINADNATSAMSWPDKMEITITVPTGASAQEVVKAISGAYNIPLL